MSKSIQFLYIAQLKHGQKLDFEAWGLRVVFTIPPKYSIYLV